MEEMNKLEKEHYQAIVDRGLIDENTTLYDRLRKIREEYNELNKEMYLDSMDGNVIREVTAQEAIDVIMSIKITLHKFGIDYNKELKKNVETQKERVANYKKE